MASTAKEIRRSDPDSAKQPERDDIILLMGDPGQARVSLEQSPVPGGGSAAVWDHTEPPAAAARLAISVDELQQFVVEDVLGAAYGVGATVDEAVEDYFGALRDRLGFLRARRDVLHPRLARQLEQLLALFPDQA